MADWAADEDVSELHAVICGASDGRDAEARIQWSHVSEHQEAVGDELTDINTHEENDMTD